MKSVVRLIVVSAVAAFLVAGVSGCRPNIVSQLGKAVGSKGGGAAGQQAVREGTKRAADQALREGTKRATDQSLREGAKRADQALRQGTRVTLVPVPQPTQIQGTKVAASAAGHAEEASRARMDLKNLSARIDDALPLTHDPAARAQLMASRRQLEDVLFLANLKKSLSSTSHEIEAQIERLPESVQRPVRAWLGVNHSCESLAASWDRTPPDVSRLCRSLKDVNERSPKLAEGLHKALVRKAVASGKRDVERALRDMEMAPHEPAAAHAAARNQLELLPLPEAPAGSAASQRGSPFKGLGDLPEEEATREAQRVYTGAVRATERSRDFQYALARQHYHVARVGQQAVSQKDRDEKQRKDRLEHEAKLRHAHASAYAEVEGQLKRKLSPSERLIVADMRGQQVDVIVKTISGLDGGARK